MARSKSSGQWLKEHFDDQYVLKAKRDGWRSRAVYKLEEIDKKDRLIRHGMDIVDLGAAPGGWSQYAARKLSGSGRVVALDILPMDSLAGVDFIEGDFRENAVLDQLVELLGSTKVDLVISDMAPNMTGTGAIDQPRAMYLAELALQFALEHLKPKGEFLVKVFQGEGFDAYARAMRDGFSKTITRKPEASRPRSREVYLLGRGLR